ncbi:MAG TPA: AMP-binding protein, partial [Xanthobacteraceae bacterium]
RATGRNKQRKDGRRCWPGSRPTGRRELNLATHLFDVARRQPERPAVSDGVHAWSYGEFARRIAGLEGGLAARGHEPGERVMLCMENCGEFLEMLFACWTAGLCAVPVNARLHPDEVAYIASDCSAGLLVATPALAAMLGPLQ